MSKEINETLEAKKSSLAYMSALEKFKKLQEQISKFENLYYPESIFSAKQLTLELFNGYMTKDLIEFINSENEIS